MWSNDRNNYVFAEQFSTLQLKRAYGLINLNTNYFVKDNLWWYRNVLHLQCCWVSYSVEMVVIHILNNDMKAITIYQNLKDFDQCFNTTQNMACHPAAPYETKILMPCFKSLVTATYLNIRHPYINGLMQDCSISIGSTLEILQSFTKPLIWNLQVPIFKSVAEIGNDSVPG